MSSTMKVVRVTMPDGSIWQIPAYVIAENCAGYYASKAGSDEDPDKIRMAEYRRVMDDHSELIDWAKGNMDWSDVRGLAHMVSPAPRVDFQEGWMNGEMTVHEVVRASEMGNEG